MNGTSEWGPVVDARRRLALRPLGQNRLPNEGTSLALLAALVVAATIACWQVSTSWFPPVFLSIPLIFGGLLLTRTPMRLLAGLAAVAIVVDAAVLGLDVARPGSILVVAVTGVIAYVYARSREETGLGGLTSDAVLVELRERLAQHGQLPVLPDRWAGEVVVQPAGGGPFAGDFVVSARVDPSRLEVALVDVSGKGVEAGTRSLLLSGAMGGLLGAKEPAEFLWAANAYLLRQEWDEGFATAVHLTVDLVSGEFAIGSAGHLPVAHFDAGSGRWGLLDADGPALGLLDDPVYTRTAGLLRPGDALLLYTDGLVEVPGRDLERGIDKLLGEADRLVTRGFAGGGRALVEHVAERTSDDRGLVLLWRTG